MRETLNARLRNLSAVVERSMVGEAGACTSAVALADWVLEEARAVAEEAERDARDDAMQGVVDHLVASQPR